MLVAPRNPLNIGAAARAMTNFGFTRLRIVNPYEVAFREARSAVHAAPVLAAAEEFSNVGDAVADCRLVVGTTSVGHRELQHPLRRLEYGARGRADVQRVSRRDEHDAQLPAQKKFRGGELSMHFSLDFFLEQPYI